MSDFIMTPMNIDLIETILKDPVSGRWSIPVLTFNTAIMNPFFGELDPLNNSPKYRKRVIDSFYLRLKEKWLYSDSMFRSLLKYFIVEEKGNEIDVSLIDDPDKTNPVNEKYKRHIYKYIEKYFITHHFVKKILKNFVAKNNIKWYDLFHNKDILKDLFLHKLKRLIKSTIYEIQERKAEKELKK